MHKDFLTASEDFITLCDEANALIGFLEKFPVTHSYVGSFKQIISYYQKQLDSILKESRAIANDVSQISTTIAESLPNFQGTNELFLKTHNAVDGIIQNIAILKQLLVQGRNFIRKG